jgi:outer membrane porin, OprD family
MYGRMNPSQCVPRSGAVSPAVIAVAVLSIMATQPAAVWAQALPAPEPAPAAAPANADDEGNTPNSTEQGQTQLPESFENKPVQAWLHESKLVGLRDMTFNAQIRSFYEDTGNMDDTTSRAWTLGGSLGLKTGYFGDFVAFGATGYTSQRLYGPEDESGTKLLRSDQRPYTVLGELYAQFRLTDEIQAVAGRRGFDTPFINMQDSLMTPNTFEVYAVQGVIGSTDASTLRFGAGYVDQMKLRNSEDFESMATAAGAPGGVDRGVYVAGANYTLGAFSLGAVDYYSKDIINIAYSEIKYAIPLPDDMRLQFGAQYAGQHSLGENLLTGKSFTTDQFGFKIELARGPMLFTVARSLTAVGTLTDTSTGQSGTSMRNPWGGYPGYTSVQIENFYRSGENATLLRAAYNFPKSTGLSVYGLWVHGSTPSVANQYAQDEYDLNLQWTAKSPALKGLSVRARYGHVSQAGPSNEHEDDLRLIVYYQLR